MNFLQITARLASPIAVYDNYSPNIDGLLEWLILESQGLASSNPTEETAITVDLPLQKIEHGGLWFWAVSSPFYQYELEQSQRYRRRWDYQERNCDWGNKRASVDTSQGNTKSYDLPLYLRNTPRIDWFAVGDKPAIAEILASCKGVGKKRSQGYGQVLSWEVQEIDTDRSLVNKKIARPLPLEMRDLVPCSAISDLGCLPWGYRPPARFPCNRALCIMPQNNAVQRSQARVV
jgi:CRISPR type IV-associated protein Csf3